VITNFYAKLLFRYHQFGGWRLVRQYIRMGLFVFVVRQIILCAFHRKPFKTIYPDIRLRVEGLLLRQYAPLISHLCNDEASVDIPSPKNGHIPNRNYVFFCWIQGIDNAPNIVKACYNSIRTYLTDKEIVHISDDNIHDWIDIPEDIARKYQKGIIPSAMYSDIIRLELLIRYGGTWIDSTVLCTGNNFPPNILTDDLFLFQYRKTKDGPLSGISSWFISAKRGNELLIVLRELLYQYWRDYDCVIDYFIFHRFFMYIAKERPEWVENITRMNSLRCLQLEQRMNEPYDQGVFDTILQTSCFHKLNYRVSDETIRNSGNLYHLITVSFLKYPADKK